MRKLISLLVAASVLYGGYWFVGSTAVETGLRTWLDQDHGNTTEIRYASLATRGFPNRFDTTITEPTYGDAATGFSWSAPFVQIFALSYKPNHIIAVLPNRQSIQTRYQDLELTSDTLRSSVVFEAGTDLAFLRSVTEGANLRLASNGGWEIDLASGQLAIRKAIGSPQGYQVTLTAKTLGPVDGLKALFRNTADLPDAVETVALDATLEFDRPWDRHAFSAEPPQLTTIRLEKAAANWGRLTLSATGDLVLDSNGYPDGRLNVYAVNWRDIYDAVLTAGIVAPNMETTLKTVLTAMANADGTENDLEIPWVFKGGRMSFGPIPLGPAPRLN